MGEVYSFRTVPRILFGPGARQRLGEEVVKLGTTPFLVASRTPLDHGDFADMINDIRQRTGHLAVVEGPRGEPDLAYLDWALAQCRQARCDVVIGVGGGSVLDAAKAVAGLFHEPRSVEEIFYSGTVAQPGIPFVAVPTTAGTGAEVTPNSVLSDLRKKVKQSIRGELLLARAVINDPELTIGVSRRVKASSGADALTQAIESFTSRHANELTDALALRAFAMIARSLLTVVNKPEPTIEPHADVAYGSMLAGMALANARLGAVHGMAHPLGVRYGIPHGVCCAVLLPYVMEFNEPAVRDKYEQLSTIVNQPVREWVSRLFERIGIPQTLAEYKIPPGDIDAIAQESLPSGSLKANPRSVTAQDLAEILAKVIR